MHTPTTRKEIEDEILWNYHLITFGGKSAFYTKEWYNAGVRSLSDILNEEGKLMTFPEFTRKYMIKTNFLRYIGSCSGIAVYWRETLKCDVGDSSVGEANSSFPLGNLEKWTCQYARSLCVSKIFQKPRQRRAS